MKPNELLDAIGQVDDKLIISARSKPKIDKKIWITAASVAACLCIAGASVLGLSSIKKIGLDEPFILTELSTAVTSAQTAIQKLRYCTCPANSIRNCRKHYGEKHIKRKHH